MKINGQFSKTSFNCGLTDAINKKFIPITRPHTTMQQALIDISATRFNRRTQSISLNCNRESGGSDYVDLCLLCVCCRYCTRDNGNSSIFYVYMHRQFAPPGFFTLDCKSINNQSPPSSSSVIKHTAKRDEFP